MKKAYKLLAEAAFMNNTDAAEKIAYPFMFGDNIKRNRTKAIHLFHLMAERGIPLGQQGTSHLSQVMTIQNKNQLFQIQLTPVRYRWEVI